MCHLNFDTYPRFGKLKGILLYLERFNIMYVYSAIKVKIKAYNLRNYIRYNLKYTRMNMTFDLKYHYLGKLMYMVLNELYIKLKHLKKLIKYYATHLTIRTAKSCITINALATACLSVQYTTIRAC